MLICIFIDGLDMEICILATKVTRLPSVGIYESHWCMNKNQKTRDELLCQVVDAARCINDP
jgi:hypothetical protein